MNWPFSKEYECIVTQSFGAEHDGIDIHVMEYQTADDSIAIYAICDGTIVDIGCNEEYGNYLIIESEDDLRIKYMHLGSLQVHMGDKVSTSTILGNFGISGQVSGPCLHLGIQKQGAWIDPLLACGIQ